MRWGRRWRGEAHFTLKRSICCVPSAPSVPPRVLKHGLFYFPRGKEKTKTKTEMRLVFGVMAHPPNFLVCAGMEVGAQTNPCTFHSGTLREHCRSAAGEPLPSPTPAHLVPHPSRAREAPTWGSASPGVFQPGVSKSWAAAPSAMPGSGSSTSAMGGADDPGKEPGERLQEGAAPRPPWAAPPACARRAGPPRSPNPRPGAAPRTPAAPQTRVSPPRSAGDPSPLDASPAWAGGGAATSRDPDSDPRPLQPGRGPLQGPLRGSEGRRPHCRARLGQAFWRVPCRPPPLFLKQARRSVHFWEPGVEKDRAAGWRGFWSNRFGNLSRGLARAGSRFCRRVCSREQSERGPPPRGRTQ